MQSFPFLLQEKRRSLLGIRVIRMTTYISTLSHSSIAMLSRCPRQFFYRYVEGLKIKPTSAMRFGTSYHEAHEFNFGQMISTGSPMSLEDTVDFFTDRWSEARAEIDWVGEKINPGTLQDIGVLGISEYYQRVLPNKNPAAVELKFEVQLPEISRTFVGIIDYVGKDGSISDHKTSSKKWPQARGQAEMQPTAYYLGYTHSAFSEQKPPTAFTYEIIVKTRMPEIQLVSAQPSQLAVEDYMSRLRTAERLIDAEVYPKTDPTNWYCNENWCAYYPHCMRRESIGSLKDIE